MNLDKIFNPKSIAIIGASHEPNTVGLGLAKNCLEGKKLRKIYFVNPFSKKILGQKTYVSIAEIKGNIDLAIIAVPAKIVPQICRECVIKKVGGIIIISAGFAEVGKQGEELQKQIDSVIKNTNIPLIGPNCLGIIKPDMKLNATFAPITPKAGDIAFISQSGALIDSVISQTENENYGFSAVISYGNEAGLTLPDFLEWAVKDTKTKVIVLYIEGLKEGRKFFETAKRISQIKPIIVLKGGKTRQTQQTVSSHTGALAGDNEIYAAMFKQAGIIEVESLQDIFDAAKLLSWQPKCTNGIAIVTNGGGAGVLMADYCSKYGINLPDLSAETEKILNDSKIMHPAWSRINPIDIVGDALSNRYQLTINTILKQKDVYGLVVIQTFQIMTESFKNAQIIVRAKKMWPKKPILTVFMGGKSDKKAIELLEKNKIPNYSDPVRAAKSLKALII